MADQTLRAVITVLDKTAAPLHAINERFAAMSGPLRQIGSRLGTLAEETGLKTISSHARDALGHVQRLGGGLLRLAGPLAALGGAASLGGLVEMVKKTAEFDKAIHLGAIATGLSAQQLGEWHYAAKIAGVEAERFDLGVQRLNRNMYLGAAGKAKDVARAFKAMGHPLGKGNLPETARALQIINEEVSHLVAGGHGAAASALLGTLMGARGGMKTQPLFAGAPEELAKRFAEARKHGIAPTGQEAAQGDEMMKSWENMSGAVDGLTLAIGRRLYPEIMRVVGAMTDWLDDDRKWIASGIGDAVQSFGDYLRAVDWSTLGEGLKTIGRDAKWAFDNLGGMKTTIGLIVAIELGPAILAWATLGKEVAKTAFKFALFPVASLIFDFARLLPVIRSLTEVQWALNMAMSANPVGAFVIALGALAGAAYLVYQNLEKIQAAMEKLGGYLPKSLTHAGEVGHTDPEYGGWVPGSPSLLKSIAGAGVGEYGVGQKSAVRVDLNIKLPSGVTAEPHVTTEGKPDWGMNLGAAFGGM